MPYLTKEWGNPSSGYKFGANLKGVVEVAREQVAELIGARPSEVIFTSCATESNNAAIHAALKSTGKRHIVTSAVEHSSILNLCAVLESDGFRITRLPVDRDGLLKLTDLEAEISNDTALVSLMWANNETGVLYPIEEIAELCQARGVLFHCDAVQATGKIPVDMKSICIDYASLSGHKIGAPKGMGAMYVRAKAPFTPLIYGGGQEGSRRGGTENVPYIVGLGIAATLACEQLPAHESRIRNLRDRLESAILQALPKAKVNGHTAMRLPNTTNIRLPGIDNTAVLALLDQNGICASSGSACMDSAITPSHVISAMTGSREHAEQSIRFSLGIKNTANEIDAVAVRMKEIVALLN